MTTNAQWPRAFVARGLQAICAEEAVLHEDGETERERAISQAYTEIGELLELWLIGADHIIEFRGTSWVLQHPLACRLASGRSLFDCPVNKAFEETVATRLITRPSGRYVAEVDQAGFLTIGEQVSP